MPVLPLDVPLAEPVADDLTSGIAAEMCVPHTRVTAMEPVRAGAG